MTCYCEAYFVKPASPALRGERISLVVFHASRFTVRCCVDLRVWALDAYRGD